MAVVANQPVAFDKSMLTACRRHVLLAELSTTADVVVHSNTNPLFAAEMTLGGLHGHMSEQELDLLQLSS